MLPISTVQDKKRALGSAPLLFSTNFRIFTIHYSDTVNSEIFARDLFSWNFAYAKFPENKILRNAENTLSFTDIGKSGPSHEFLASQMCRFNLFSKIKFSRMFPDLQYLIILHL